MRFLVKYFLILIQPNLMPSIRFESGVKYILYQLFKICQEVVIDTFKRNQNRNWNENTTRLIMHITQQNTG